MIFVLYFLCLVMIIVIWLGVVRRRKSFTLNNYIIAIYNVVFLTVMFCNELNNAGGASLISADGFHNLLKAIFLSASIITFDSGFVELTGVLSNSKMMIIVMAPIVTVANVVISVFFQKMLDSWRERIELLFAKEIYVFRGGLEDLRTLTNEVYIHDKKGKKACVVVIPTVPLEESSFCNALVSNDAFFEKKLFPEKKQHYYRMLDRILENTIYRNEKSTSEGKKHPFVLLDKISESYYKIFYKIICRDRIYHIVLLPDEESRNMQLLNRINDKAEENLKKHGLIMDSPKETKETENPPEKETAGKTIKESRLEELISSIMVVAFVENDTLRYDTVKLCYIKYRLLSEENTVIRKTIQANLPIRFFIDRKRMKEEDNVFYFTGKMHLCLVGFGSYAQEFLLQTFENTYFTLKSTNCWALEVHVFNWKPHEKKRFLDRCPYFNTSDIIVWEENSYERGGIIDRLLRNNIGYYDEIMIADNDIKLNYSRTKDLMRVILSNNVANDVKPLIVVDLGGKSDEEVNEVKDKKDGNEDRDKTVLSTPVFHEYENYYVLPGNRNVFQFSALIDWKKDDEDAKAWNDIYNKGEGSAIDWFEMDYFIRLSNYAALWDIKNKEQLLTKSIKEKDAETRSNAYWKLAQYEHQRWMAYHFARGWTAIFPEDLRLAKEYKESGESIIKIPSAKKHLLLVPWPDIEVVLNQIGKADEIEGRKKINYDIICESFSDKSLLTEKKEQ